MMLAGLSSGWPPVVPSRAVIMPESGTLGKLLDTQLLFVRDGFFQFGDPVGADLMNNAAQFLDARAKSGQLFLADLVMLRVSRFRISLLQLLKHRAFAMGILGPNAVEAVIKTLGK